MEPLAYARTELNTDPGQGQQQAKISGTKAVKLGKIKASAMIVIPWTSYVHFVHDGQPPMMLLRVILMTSKTLLQ